MGSTSVVNRLCQPVDIQADENNGELRFIRYSSIEPEEVEWLVEGRIPLGKITMLQGNPGVGKSYLACDLMARVSKGKSFPDGGYVVKGESVFFTSEDGAADTIRPRLDSLGANPNRVHHFDCAMQDGKESDLDLSRDVSKLERFLKGNPGVKLLIFDPLQAYLGEKTNSHKNADVRRLLGPLSRLAENCRVAIIGINHLNKGQGKATFRGIGSIAFNALARAVWQVSEDSEDRKRRLFLPVKINLADPKGLAYRIDEEGLHWEDGIVETTADDAEDSEHGGEGESRQGEAEDWLRSLLEEKGSVSAKEAFAIAKGDGIHGITLKRAKKTLGVQSRRVKEGWMWQLPTKAPANWNGDALKQTVADKKAKGINSP